jgi:hypothetical protein
MFPPTSALPGPHLNSNPLDLIERDSVVGAVIELRGARTGMVGHRLSIFERAALGRLELTDLWGIAGRLAERLRAIGIITPLELRDADHRLIRERFSVVLERMVLELRGVAYMGLEEVTPDRKSLVASRSFGRPVETRRELEEAVSVYAARAAEKVRRQNLATASIAVWVQTNSFKPSERQYSAAKAAVGEEIREPGRAEGMAAHVGVDAGLLGAPADPHPQQARRCGGLGLLRLPDRQTRKQYQGAQLPEVRYALRRQKRSGDRRKRGWRTSTCRPT